MNFWRCKPPRNFMKTNSTSMCSMQWRKTNKRFSTALTTKNGSTLTMRSWTLTVMNSKMKDLLKESHSGNCLATKFLMPRRRASWLKLAKTTKFQVFSSISSFMKPLLMAKVLLSRWRRVSKAEWNILSMKLKQKLERDKITY